MYRSFQIIIFLAYLTLFWIPCQTQISTSTAANSRGITVGRQDNNYDLVIYLNGQPLQANQQLNLAAFQQTTGIVLPNGQRIPPTVQVVNGQLQTSPTPAGMVNLVITIQRTYFGPIYGK